MAPMHEEYQELCAAAGIGEVSLAEVAHLHEHLRNCKKCRRAYSEFTSLAAQRYVQGLSVRDISREEAGQLPDSDLLRRRFMQRAAEKGIVVSNRAVIANSGNRRVPSVPLWQRLVSNALAPTLAGAVLLACVLCAYR